MPDIPSRSEQIMQSIIDGTTYTDPPLSRNEDLLLKIKNVIEQGGGTTDYSDLSNKPSINSIELNGNKSLSDLGIVNPMMIKGRVTSVASLPVSAEPGWVYFVGALSDTDLAEYVYTEDRTWEFIGYSQITIDSELSNVSENPVQNKVVKAAIDSKIDTSVLQAMTQAEYDALITKSAPLYFIYEEE